MDNEPRDRTSSAPGRRRPPYPLHKVVAAVARAETDGVVNALGDAGFARDRIEVVTAENVPGLDGPIGGSGVRGLLTRLNLSIGDDLDELEQARQELLYGHALLRAMGDHDAGGRRPLIAAEHDQGVSPVNTGVPRGKPHSASRRRHEGRMLGTSAKGNVLALVLSVSSLRLGEPDKGSERRRRGPAARRAAAHCPGRPGRASCAGRLRCDPSTVTFLVDRLEERGLVER
jgi:hypothetical protein